MTDFIISGTSGVGKTHLEELLEKDHGFYHMVKWMDRDPRPGESDNPKAGFVSKEEFIKQKSNGEFIFTLEYAGKNYGWRKDDYEAHSLQNRTMGVTLESLKDFPNQVPEFVPILLHIDPSNFSLIAERIKKRELSEDMTPEQIERINEKINQRLELAEEENKNFDIYKRIVEENNGKIFSITGDDTIHKEVIPWILSRIKK